MNHQPEIRLGKRFYIFLFIGIFLVGGYFFVSFYGSRISGETLKKLVADQTNKVYTADFDDISISLPFKEIVITNFRLNPNQDSSGTDLPTLFSLSIPKVSIQVGSLVKLYKDRVLTIRTIAVDDPHIEMVRQIRSKDRTFSLEAGDLYKMIGSYLNKFAIDSLSLMSGKFQYADESKNDGRNILINELDFKVKNLVIDSSEMTSNRFLYAEDLIINLTNQDFYLDDSIHQIHFDNFRFSTKSKNILFENLSIKQRDGITRDISEFNQYDVSIPKLNFRGVDFYKAYSENILSMDSMRVADAAINIKLNSNTQGTEESNNSVLALLSKIYDEVNIGSIYLDNSSLEVRNTSPTQSLNFSIQQTNGWINNLGINFDRFSLDKRKKYVEEFRLSGSQFHFQTDSNHLVSVRDLRISSIDSMISIANYKVKFPNQQFNLNASGPKIDLTGLDFHELWLRKNISINNVTLEQPNVDLQLFSTAEVQKTSSPFIKNIHVNGVSMDQLKIKVRKGDQDLSIKEFDLLGRKFRFDETTKDQPFDSIFSDFSIKSSEILYRNPKAELTIASLNLPKHFHEIIGKKIDLSTRENDSLLRLSDLYLTGFKPMKLIKEDKLHFNGLSLSNMDLSVLPSKSNDSMQMPKILQRPRFKSISLNNININIVSPEGIKNHLHDIDGKIHEFSMDDNNRVFTAMDLRVDSIDYVLPKIGHHLIAKDFEIKNKDSTLHIGMTRFMPIDSLAKDRFSYTGTSMRLHHVDFHRLLNDGQIIFGNGYIADPAPNILIKRKSDQKQPLNQIVRFNSLNISHGKLDYIVHNPELHFESDTFNLLINKFDLQNDSLFYYADNYIVDAKNFHFKSETLHDTISIKYIIASTKSGDFEIRDLTFEQEQLMRIHVPKVHMRGLKTLELLKQKLIEWDTLTFENPVLDLGLEKRNDSHYFSKSTSRKLPSLKAGFIDLENGNINIHHPDVNHGDSIHFHSLMLAINNMHLEEGKEISLGEPFFDSFDLSGEDLVYKLPDSLYEIKVHKYGYDHILKKVTIDGFELLPLYTKDEFAELIDYQSDWFKGSVQHLQLDEFYVDSILFHKVLDISKISADGLILDTHRDKRIPRKTGVVKPLPVKALKSLPFKVNVDTIMVSRGFVSHSEYSETGDLPGSLFFSKIDGQIINITNDSFRIAENNRMVFDASGSLMQTGNFDMVAIFDLASSSDEFVLSGRLGVMDLTELNDFLENTAAVIIKDGKNEAMTFNFNANDKYAIGEMRFYYDDLKISILKDNPDTEKSHGSSIKSFFANTFIVNTRNPHFIFLRQGDIFHQRDVEKSIFNYWGKSLISGAVSSIGAKNNKKEIRKLNKELKDQLDKSSK